MRQVTVTPEAIEAAMMRAHRLRGEAMRRALGAAAGRIRAGVRALSARRRSPRVAHVLATATRRDRLA